MQYLFRKENLFHTLFIAMAVILGASSIGILFFEDTKAALTRNYDDSHSYTYENVEIEAFNGGIARLAELDDLVDDDNNMMTGFGAGTFFDTEFDDGNGVLQLDVTGLTNGLGTFSSRIMYGGEGASWETITWNALSPYKKELPDNEGVETAYDEDNIDMTGNIILLHFNEEAGTNFSNTSGVSNDGICDDSNNLCPLLAQDSVFQNAVTFDGIDDRITIPFDLAHNELPQVTIALWVKRSEVGGSRLFALDRELNGQQSLWAMLMNGSGAAAKVTAEIDLNDNGIQRPYALTSNFELLVNEWTHVAFVYDGTDLKLYFNGQFDKSLVETLGTPLLGSGIYPMNLGNQPGIGVGNQANRNTKWGGSMDEFSVWSRGLSASEVLSLYNRGAKNLKLQVRSCDDDICDGETFIGPDGTNASYYSELSNNTVGLPSFDITNVADNAYFQYQATLESDIVDESPQLTSVTFTPDHYSTESPYVVNNSDGATSYHSLISFEEILGSNNAGTVTYQLSSNGNTFYYFDGDSWVEVESDDDTNTAEDINTNIATFHEDVSRGKLIIKSFLNAPDTISQVELTSLIYGYQPPTSSVSSPSTTTPTTSTPTTQQETTETSQETEQQEVTQTETEQQIPTQQTEEEQAQQEPVIEVIMPSYGVSINNDQACTGTTAAIVSLMGGNSVEFQISEDEMFTDIVWKPFISALQRYTLSDTDGEHTVYARFRDINQTTSETVSDSIVLDQEFNCVTSQIEEESIEEEMVEEIPEETLIEETEEIEEIIPLPSQDGMVHDTISSAYYLFKAPLSIFPILNQLIYFTYGLSFNTVPEADITESGAQIENEAYPLSGSVLVKTPEDEKVYLTKRNVNNKYLPFLQWIADESVAETLFGSTWNQFVIDVSSSLIENAPKGTDILSLEDIGQLTALKSRPFLESSAPQILFSEHEKANGGYVFNQMGVLSDGIVLYDVNYIPVTQIAGQNLNINYSTNISFDKISREDTIYSYQFDNLDVFNNYTASEIGSIDTQDERVVLVEKNVIRDIELENDIYITDDFSYALNVYEASCLEGSELVSLETIALAFPEFIPEPQRLAQILALAADYYASSLDTIGFNGGSFVQSIQSTSKALLTYQAVDGSVRITFMGCQ